MATSGRTSTVTSNSKGLAGSSSPSPPWRSGLPSGVRPFFSSASPKDFSRRVPLTSARIAFPNRISATFRGRCPTRKPGTWTPLMRMS